jgi:hypothetical protein
VYICCSQMNYPALHEKDESFSGQLSQGMNVKLLPDLKYDSLA